MTSTVTTTSRHATASAVILDRIAGRVLLIGHLQTGYLQCPGGHVEADEAPHEAVIREIAEETQVEATLWVPAADRAEIPGGRRMPTPLMVTEFPAPPKPHKGEPAHHHLDHLYIAIASSVAPLHHQAEEVNTAVWVDYADLDQPTYQGYQIRPDVPVVVRAALTRMGQPTW